MRRAAAAIAVALLSGLLWTSGALAATDVGNVCTTEFEVNNLTVIPLANTSSALPIAAPSAGVVTSWRITSGAAAADPQRLEVVRPTANKNEFGLVAESAVQNVVKGVNSFDARIPVKAGDRFGNFGGMTTPTLFCSGKSGDTMGIFIGKLLTTDAPVFFNEGALERAPVSATIEPDADGDGFGDETQDKCPQSAAFQVPCPQIAIEDFAVVGRAAVTMVVTTDRSAPVTVTASAKAGKSPKKPGKGPRRRVPVGGSLALSGGTQTVLPGKLTQFQLEFPAQLKSELRALPRAKSVSLTIVASSTNEAGQAFAKTTTVKLKGQAKG